MTQSFDSFNALGFFVAVHKVIIVFLCVWDTYVKLIPLCSYTSYFRAE